MENDIMKCDSPSLINDQGYSIITSGDIVFYHLEISIDGGRNIEGPPQNFSYYKDPKLSAISPEVGPIKGGTVV